MTLGFCSGSMWWSRRLWIFLAVVFLLKNAEGLGVWNQKPAQRWYTIASASMHQPGQEPSQISRSSCFSRSQLDTPEAQTVSGSAGPHRTVLQSDLQVPGALPLLYGSSDLADAQLQGSKSSVGMPQVSSSLFQQVTKHKEAPSSLDSTSQGFFSWDTAAALSSPSHQSGQWSVLSGASQFLPSQTPAPSGPVPSPQQYSQFPYPSQTRDVPQSSSSHYEPLYSKLASSWQPIGHGQPARCQILGSNGRCVASTSQQTASDSVQKGGSRIYGDVPSPVVGTWEPPSQPSTSDSASKSTHYYDPVPAQGAGMWQSAGSALTSGRDVPQSSSSHYEPLYSKLARSWQPIGHGQPARCQVLGSNGRCVASTSQQTASDSVQKGGSRIYGDVPSPVVGTWEPPSQPSTSDSASKSTHYYDPVPAQGAGMWQTTGLQSAGSELTSTSQLFGRDVPQKSSSHYEPLYSKFASTWQPIGHGRPAQSQKQAVVHAGQSQMPGCSVHSGVTHNTQVSAQSGGSPGPVFHGCKHMAAL